MFTHYLDMKSKTLHSRSAKAPVWSLLGLGLYSTTVLAAQMATTDEVHDLEPQVVTATRTEQPMKTAPASVSLITASSLETTASGSLMSALRDISGLNLVGRGVGGRKVLLLRGMESRHALILVDGRRVSSTDDVVGHSDFQYDWVPLNAIERIEIIRGPMSALYGSEAMGGVINILTKPVPSIWSFGTAALLDVREDGRGGDLAQFSFNAAGPISENLGIRVDTLYRYQDDTSTEANPLISELEGVDLRNLNLNLTWELNAQNRLDLSWTYSDEERWRQLTTSKGVNYLSSYDLLKQQVGLRWRTEVLGWSGQAGAYQTTSDVENRATEGVAPSEPQYLTDRIVDFDFSRRLWDNHQLTFGGELRDELLEHKAFAAGERSVLHQALFLQDGWALNETLSLTAAGRWDHHELFGDHYTPRAYLVWQFHEYWVLKGGYGTGFKAPTLKQISPEYKFVGPHTFVGNADLQPESSDTWELSLLWEPNPRFSLAATVFRNEIDDLINTVAIENVTAKLGRVYKYFNVDKSEVTGVETEIAWRPLEQTSLHLNHTWLDAHDLSNDLHLPGRPEHRLNASFQHELLPQTLHWGGAFEYNGTQWEQTTTGESTLPAYQIASTWLRWTIATGHRVTFGVQNLANVDLTDKSDAYGYAERGRSYYLRWQSEF